MNRIEELLDESGLLLTKVAIDAGVTKYDLYNYIEENASELFFRARGIERDMMANVDLYSGFVYDEDETVLTTPPTITTTATKDSPTGVYVITVSGATADNYDIGLHRRVATHEGRIGRCELDDIERCESITGPAADGTANS